MKVNNMAEMREALSDACYAMFNFLKTQHGGYEEMANALDKAKSALAASPRNCDVGTAARQTERFWGYCNSHSCNECPARGGWRTVYIDGTSFKMIQCGVLWSQMPYEAEEGGAE